MAIPKSAQLIAAETVGPRARRLEFAMTDPAALGFVGGQYIIIDTGMVLASGKLAKRAYSIASSDADQTHFELIARRIDGGVCSNYLHQLEVGSTMKFSGPWGKFLPAPASGATSTWVVATDTGITAALGLLAGAAFADRLARTTLLWLSSSADDFVSDAFVRQRAEKAGPRGDLRDIRFGTLPPVHHPERIFAGLTHFEDLRRSATPERVYLAGDGALLYPFANALTLAGLAESQLAIESFFNVPVKKVDISAGGDAK
ncbi:MAG TPA: FAD-dependent oxidoreductase [Polyangiaceae bacterium]|nr:FAD-dependent oxidoreductase [Polyangiaceae bacterium]